MRIMIVDDEAFVAEGLKNMLDWDQFDGSLVAVASNGQEALDYAKETLPDVVISDIKMPVMDGLCMAQHFFKEFPNVKLILLTAHGEFDYAKEAIRYGVSDYILKPITRQKIVDLQELLIRINANFTKDKKELLDITSNARRESFVDALKDGNKEIFDQFFSSADFLHAMSGANSSYIGIYLIDIIYTFFSEMKLDSKPLDLSREMTIQEFLEQTGTEDKVNYLITKYYDIIVNISKQKQNNIDNLALYAKKYVKEHFTETSLSISSIADALNISISYLSALFKHSTGINLSNYITTLRIESAKSLLGDPKYSITEIAKMTGYEDPRYFAKIFKRKTSLTPSEFRNMNLSS